MRKLDSATSLDVGKRRSRSGRVSPPPGHAEAGFGPLSLRLVRYAGWIAQRLELAEVRPSTIIGLLTGFDTMTAEPPHGEGRSREGALREIKCRSGTHFDPPVVDAFLTVIRDEAVARLMRRPHEKGESRCGNHTDSWCRSSA